VRKDPTSKIGAVAAPSRDQVFDTITANIREALREHWGPPAEIRHDLQRVREIRGRLNKLHGHLARFLGRAPPPRWRHKRGRRPHPRGRQVQIAHAVATLVEYLPLEATRSHAERRKKSPSACSIIQSALEQLGEHLSERTVEGIYSRYKQVVTPYIRRGQKPSTSSEFFDEFLVPHVIIPDLMAELERTPPSIR
jgi:hypothetical protein